MLGVRFVVAPRNNDFGAVRIVGSEKNRWWDNNNVIFTFQSSK